MKLKLTLIFLLFVNKVLADTYDFANEIREQLVYPKPLIYPFSNPVPSSNATDLAVLATLNKLQLCLIQVSSLGSACKPTIKGEGSLIPVLNISNYEVSSWKIKLGEVDIEVGHTENVKDKIVINGIKKVVSKNELYSEIVSLLPEDVRKRFEDTTTQWSFDVSSKSVEELRKP
jgi:hypothetical protein